MALIKCQECGKEFSDKASACPNCACPVELKNVNITCKKSYQELTNSEKQKVMSYRKLNKEFWIGTRPLFMILTILGLVLIVVGFISMSIGMSITLPMLLWIPAFILMMIAYIIYCAILPKETNKWYEENKEKLYRKEILK